MRGGATALLSRIVSDCSCDKVILPSLLRLDCKGDQLGGYVDPPSGLDWTLEGAVLKTCPYLDVSLDVR